MKRYIVIVAGGKGLRMKTDIPKQFLCIAGKPVLMRTIEAFDRWDSNAEKIVVLPKEQFDYWNELCQKYSFSISNLRVVPGGETRFHSVKNALDTLPTEGIVGIHDGVRPLVPAQVIDECFDLKPGEYGAIPAVPVTDSLRQIDASGSHAEDRSRFRAIQTPQVFDLRTLKAAYEKGLPTAHSFTDDASVMEAAGHHIKLVEGSSQNIKITAPTDLLIANAIFEQNNAACQK